MMTRLRRRLRWRAWDMRMRWRDRGYLGVWDSGSIVLGVVAGYAAAAGLAWQDWGAVGLVLAGALAGACLRLWCLARRHRRPPAHDRHGPPCRHPDPASDGQGYGRSHPGDRAPRVKGWPRHKGRPPHKGG